MVMFPNDLSSQAADGPALYSSSQPSTLVTRDALLTALTARMRRSLNSSDILQTAVTDLRQFFVADRVIICRFGAQWRGMVVMESVGADVPSLLGAEIDAQSSDHDWVDTYLQGKGRAIADLTTSPATEQGLSDGHYRFLQQLQAQAHLIMPVLQDCQQGPKLGGWAAQTSSCRSQQAQFWGLLIVQHCSHPQPWQEADLQVLEQVSSLLAIAIRQGDLYSIAQAELIKYQRAESARKRLSQILKQQQQNDLHHTLQQEITQRHHLEMILAHEQALTQLMLQSVRDAVITTDDEGEIQILNPVAERLTGWTQAEAQSQPLRTVFQVVDEVNRRPLISPLNGSVQRLNNRQGLLLSRTGVEHTIEITVTPLHNQDEHSLGTLLIFNDLVQANQVAPDLSWHATHDSLTQLMNRRTFEQQLTHTIIGVRQHCQTHVLCHIDLDQLSIINNDCGHVAGDQLLCQVTTLLQRRVRSTDTLARLGGDEFALLLHQCSLDQATEMATTLKALLRETPFRWQGKQFTISVSIGLVTIDAHTQDAPSALRAADAACLVAKEPGYNGLHVYSSTDQELSQHFHERQWIAQIHEALAGGRFCLYSQPIRPLTANHPDIHCEILLRLVDQDGQHVLPTAFIPAAERYNLMPMIDRWVVETFCRHYQNTRRTRTSKDFQYLYNINLSGTSVNTPQFLDFLQEQLARFQVPPETLCFEITETAAISDLDQAAQFMHALRQLGCHFALDDFGRGMSSLAYLKNLPVNYLKIDGGFVKQLVTSHTDAAIVDCFNHLSHELGIATIAECVENDQTLKKLRTIGVDYVQGFGIAKPQPLRLAYA